MDKREFLKGSAAMAAAMMTASFGESNAFADDPVPGTSIPRTNWAGNYRYSTSKVFQPTSVTEVQDAVRSVDSVRALGTRHAFNGIADSKVAQISTLKLRDVVFGPDPRTVTVGAGIRYGDLATILDAKGLALHNLASLPHISVGGACATATHGSGRGNGNLATQVTAVEFVAGDGSVHTLSRDKDGDRFTGVVVALGALGVVTHLTLAVQPRFDMTQVVYHRITPHLFITELRAIAADDLWMSMAYKRPSLAIHFTWKPETDAVMKLLPQIEAKLAPFQARPHWAKVFTMKTAALEPLYPRFQDFRALAQEFDPKGKFRNRYIHDHLDPA